MDTYLGYAQSFVDYVKKVGTIKKLPLSEYSTQSFKKFLKKKPVIISQAFIYNLLSW